MSNTSDLKLKKILPNPGLLLKDYLRDDLSSCSSNGFKSFPRRHCCTTVRFLLEVDHVKNAQLYKRKELLKIKSKSASSATRSAFQRASDAVIHAVKKLPFASSKSPATLTKSFSRKFMKRSFWKKTQHKETKRLKSFGDVKPKLSDSTLVIPVAKSTISVTDSSSTMSNSFRKSNSWSDKEFTSSDDLQCLSSNSEISEAESKILPEKIKKMAGESLGVTTGECCTDNSTTEDYSVESIKKEWINGEEKEQFSPVSVLDFPCDDEDEVSSPFQHNLIHAKGNNQKLSQKTRRVGNLSHIEPLNLEKRIELSESKNKEKRIESLAYASLENEEENTKTKLDVAQFIKKIKRTIPSSVSFKFNPDKLLADFFEETNMIDELALNVACNWMKGQPDELFLGWEIRENRDAYITDMEKNGEWRELGDNKNGVVLELEDEVFTDLVNELLS